MGVHVLMLSNSASGRGESGRRAVVIERIVRAIRRAGHELELLEVRQVRENRELLADALTHADVFVIAGGDGTVHHALAACIDARVPVYQVPLGTENLFARHFGMTKDEGVLIEAIEAFERERFGSGFDFAHPKSLPPPAGGAFCCVDAVLATWGDQRRLFGIMASVGPDAGVIARLAAVRKGGISHLSYVLPIVAEVFSAYLPKLMVSVDGREIAREERGMLIIANSPEYALGVNPARGASLSDGTLDVVFMPAESAVGAGLWLARCAARMQFEADSRCDGCRVASGRSVTIEFEREVEKRVMQFDGECVLVEGTASEAAMVRFELLPGALFVLKPASKPVN